MENMGERLSDLLRRAGKLNPDQVLDWIEPVVAQLAEVHRQGRFQGDITPDRIGIYSRMWYCFPVPDRRRQGQAAAETGAGFWQMAEERPADMRSTGRSGLSSLPYEALELHMDRGKPGPWSDVYSLCAVIYHAVTGIPPQDPQSRVYREELKTPLELGVYLYRRQEAVMKGLSLLVKDRYQNAGELYEALYQKRRNAGAGTGAGGKKDQGKPLKNVLRANRSSRRTNKKMFFLGTSIRCDLIRSVTFLDTLEDMPSEHWDVSADGSHSVLAWAEKSGNVLDVYIAAEGGVTANPDCGELFKDCERLQRIHFHHCFDTSRAVTMSEMFAWCGRLEEIDVKDFNTAGVTGMQRMFQGCASLRELDLRAFDTSEVTDMSGMFTDCAGLKKLDVRSFQTSKVTTMAWMFSGCSGLRELEVAGFDTGAVTDMRGMFSGCSGLVKLDLTGFETGAVHRMNMKDMFYGCSSLTEAAVRKGAFPPLTPGDQEFLMAKTPCKGLRYV